MDNDIPQRERRLISLKVIILTLLLAAAFAMYARYFIAQRAGGLQVSANLAVFDARLQNLENSILLHEKRLKDLEDSSGKLTASSQATSPAPAPADKAQPPESSPPAAGDARIAALEKEIASLKENSPQDGERIYRSIRLLSAFHHLSDKIMSGRPFAVELTDFEESAGTDASSGTPLSTLAPFADSGIPTFATLLVAFDQSVDALNAAEAVPPADADFWERFKYTLAHIVTVRRIGEAQTGTSVNAIVGRAQAHLERQEIEAAVAEIKSLPEGARGNFSAWLDDAQVVTEAPSLVDQMEEQVMQKAFQAKAAASAPAPVNAPAPSPAQPPQTSPVPPLNSAPDNSSQTPKT